MKKELKATLEIVRIEYVDIITTSTGIEDSEHDNGYIEGGDLAYSLLKD